MIVTIATVRRSRNGLSIMDELVDACGVEIGQEVGLLTKQCLSTKLFFVCQNV
jgi:hypothetical protein